MRPLEDDQALLGTLLDDTLRHHLGEGTVARLDRLRELSKQLEWVREYLQPGWSRRTHIGRAHDM